MGTLPEGLFFDLVAAAELDNAIEIEEQGFPPDEAATLDAFRFRQSAAPDLFLGAFLPPRTLIGYVCATLAAEAHLTHASMAAHTPGGASVCVHSLCVAPAHRRRGVARALLDAYAARLTGGPYERIVLIAHEELRGLYERAGFTWVGPSAVAHGARPWFELQRALAPPPAAEQAQPALPPGLWEALRRPAGARPAARRLASFAGGVADVREADPAGGGAPRNRHDLVCPRPGCGSTILLRGAGTWVERASVQIDPADGARHELLPALPAPPETAQWWLVGPSPMAFENIGFSRPVAQLTDDEGRKLKLLICAECDLGPLGWSVEGGKQFWLACARVAYRTP